MHQTSEGEMMDLKDLWMEDLTDVSLVDDKKTTECHELRNVGIFWWYTMYISKDIFIQTYF